MPHRYPKKRGSRWISGALEHHAPGALHRQLGVRPGTKIPVKLLREAASAPMRVLTKLRGACTVAESRLLRKRARLALTLRGLGKRKKKRR